MTVDATACCAPLQAVPLDVAEATELARRFAALSDPVRLRLLSLLATSADGAVCACDLVEPVGKSQPTVSHHLKVLREAGLVTSEKRGHQRLVRRRPRRARRPARRPRRRPLSPARLGAPCRTRGARWARGRLAARPAAGAPGPAPARGGGRPGHVAVRPGAGGAAAARRARPARRRDVPGGGERQRQVDGGRGGRRRGRAQPRGRQPQRPAQHPLERVTAARGAAARPLGGLARLVVLPARRDDARPLHPPRGPRRRTGPEPARAQPRRVVPRGPAPALRLARLLPAGRAGGGAVVHVVPGAGRRARRAGEGRRAGAVRHPLAAAHRPAGATVLQLSERGIEQVEWQELDLVDHWRRYLADPRAYLRHVVG